MDANSRRSAALENQINASNALHKIRCGNHREGLQTARWPLDADRILQERGITVVLDILPILDGVVVSYFEWVQNIQSVSWTEEEVNGETEGYHGSCV